MVDLEKAKMDDAWFLIDDHVWNRIQNIKQTLRQIQGGYQNCSYILMYVKKEATLQSS